MNAVLKEKKDEWKWYQENLAKQTFGDLEKKTNKKKLTALFFSFPLDFRITM